MDMPAYVRDDELFSHGTEEEEGSNRSQSIKKEQKSSLNFIVVLSLSSYDSSATQQESIYNFPQINQSAGVSEMA